MTYEWHALDEATHYKAMAAYYEAQAAEQAAWEEEQRIGQERIERGVCPYCESARVTETGTGGAGGTDSRGNEVDVCWTDYRCDECGGEWAMELAMTEYREYDELYPQSDEAIRREMEYAAHMEQQTALTLPLICPACHQLDSYVLRSTLVTCTQCGATAHVTEYGDGTKAVDGGE